MSVRDILERYEYDAYGKLMVYDSNYVVKASGSDYTNVGFTGQRIDILDDGNLTMNYYKNRWYDAETGRFISHDPLGYLADINMYQYVRSNSIVLTDSLGLWDERIHVGITGLVADLAGFGNCVDDVSGWANLQMKIGVRQLMHGIDIIRNG